MKVPIRFKHQYFSVMDPSNLDLDFDLIEQDPEGFCDQFEIEALEEYIRRATDLYYNSDDPNHKGLSDYAYDWLVYRVSKHKRQIAKSTFAIGAKPRTRNCVRLPYYMPSLDKVKIGLELEQFLVSSPTGLHYSLKLDGISALMIYRQGVATHCYLRGDGVNGGDISFIIEHLQHQLPKLTTGPLDIAVRGELIVTKKFWNENFGQSSRATARNWVSGLLNSSTISPALKNIDFVAYEVVDTSSTATTSVQPFPFPIPTPPPPTCRDGFQLLTKWGFKVVQNGPLDPSLSANVLMLYKTALEHYEYLIDGVVLTRNLPKTKSDHLANPTDSVAFKINLQEQMRETVITGIDWRYTRHGRLVPVACFRPVFIDGARIQRCFVFNAQMCIKKYQLGLDTRIVVTRSGGVIPILVRVVEVKGTPILPQIPYKWHWQGCDIVLDDPDKCPEVILKRHVHFFETLDVSGLREGMIKRMVDGGLVSLKEIVTASKERLRAVSGIGPKRSEKYYEGIRQQLSNVYLYRLMVASGCFPSGIGKNMLRTVVQAYPDILVVDRGGQLQGLAGIGKTRSGKIRDGLKVFKEFLEGFPLDLQHLKTQTTTDPQIVGKTFVLTHVDDERIEDYIIDHGGHVVQKVDETVHCVVSGNILLMSEKQIQAHQHNIKVYTISEFSQNYGLNLGRERTDEL
jgi:NAD-dependent DNA ligase